MKKIIIIFLSTIILIIGGFVAIDYFNYHFSVQKTEQKFLADLFQNQNLEQSRFSGEKGKKVFLNNQKIKLDASVFKDNYARFYNTIMPNGEIIYFFAVKDKQGVFRVAANACQVCEAGKGYRQEGDNMICLQCGRRYPIERIATERGGCNPEPINSNLEVIDGKIFIHQSDLKKVLNLF